MIIQLGILIKIYINLRCWDLAMGKSVKTLTNHKKAIRAMVVHPEEYTFASGAADNIKVWKCPEG
jgi:pleiotropic regulator 1